MSWQDKIRDPRCTLCPLHEDAQYVCLMGTGSKKARLMIVGEAPGEREDETHQAFVGPAGKLLTTLLEEVGISREDCYITNAVKCRPRDNATPGKPEVKSCVSFLDSEIQKVQPTHILTLGNTALQSLTGKSGITKYRGKVFPRAYPVDEWTGYIFPTFHPAAALRNPKYLPSIRADLQSLARSLKGDSTADDRLATKTKLITTSAQLRALVRVLDNAEEIAFDLETTGLHEWAPGAAIVTLGVSWGEGLAAVVPINHSSKKEPPYALRELKPVLERKDCKYIAHNAKFDCKWLARFGIYVPITFDTMLAAHILEENQQKGLKPLSQIVLGADDYGIDVKDCYNEPLKRLAIYNGKDCDYTLRLYHVFREQLKEEPRKARVFKKLMMPVSEVFTKIETRGIWVDGDRLDERQREALKRVAGLEKQMKKTCSNKDINFNSPVQVAQWLFGDLKLPMIERTAKGAPSTKESVLLQLAKKNKSVGALLEYRRWSKFLSTYLVPWERGLDQRSRIHPSYRLSGTVTGRLSSSDPNLQQVPRDSFIRGILGAPDGWTFVEADYSQVELRIAAMLSNEREMLRAFNAGEDVHMKTACETTGKNPNEVTKEERKKAKAINFGFLYGMGAKKFVIYARDNYDVEVTLAEAEAVRDRFFATYPGLRPWHERQRRLVRRHQRVSSPLGRVRHLPDVLSSSEEVCAEAERQAINSPVQGFASDLMLVSALRLDSTLPSRVAQIVGSVHDSLLFQVRDDYCETAVETIREVMEDTTYIKKVFGVDITVPIEVEIKVGTHWGEGQVIGV